MSVLSDLSLLLGRAFESIGLDPAHGSVLVSNRPDLGQFQCNGALAAARQARRNPREIAASVVGRIGDDSRLADVSLAGPGFINLTVTDDVIARYVSAMADDPRLGVPAVSEPLDVIVDYAGPNVAKAMHVGHLRATIIGDSLKRLLRFVGHRVLGDAHFGDWGLQMGMLIVAAREHLPDLPHLDGDFEGPYTVPPPITLADLQEWYPAIAARVGADEDVATEARRATRDLQSGRAGYEALWEHFVRVSRESQERDFADLGVQFDLWYGESTVRCRLRPMVDDALAAGVALRSEGAVVVEVAEPDDKTEISPLILETSHGAFLYGTTDLATIAMRVDELDADLVLYVVDARQAYHFEQVFRAARRTGAAGGAGMEHIRFGTMNARDGTPFKTRAGGVLKLQDLIGMVTEAAIARLEESDLAAGYPEEERSTIARQVGIAALKFGDLINNRTSNYVFDLRRFTSLEGKTGPYLQMAAVRMGSILDKAVSRGLVPGPVLPPAAEVERRLMLRMLQLPEVTGRAVELRAPNHLAEYAYELASDFSRFYEACHILTESDSQRRASWLALVRANRCTLALLLDLLGIEVPERM
ncbi:MAG: arginine--tRNA ligase [bacterium]|nr:arginine--tRNA ligase [bacterium]MDE0288419.1 arginine--tRNA ligase [bacterium]MDE0438361.1 arginine--tRNA ligase [bacterium]